MTSRAGRAAGWLLFLACGATVAALAAPVAATPSDDPPQPEAGSGTPAAEGTASPSGEPTEPAVEGAAAPEAGAETASPDAAVEEEKEPEPFELGRVSFQYRVPREQGGGLIQGTAGQIETRGENEAELSGGVEVRYRRLRIGAENIVVHRDTMTLEAQGDVVFDQGPRRIGAERADVDLATETGTFWNASAYAEPDQYFQGEVVIKTGENSFEIRRGVVTSCTGDPTPDWSIKVSSANIEIGGYARMRNSRLRMKKLPFFYVPYLIWPAKVDRASGFLIPNIGYSDRLGYQLGLAYYQTLGDSADLTFTLDGWETTYAGGGAELRYRPTEGTKGNLAGYLLSDRDAKQSEWRVLWNQSTSDLPWGLRGVISVNQYSDYDFYREFLRSETENTRSYLYSNAFLSGNWGAQSLSMIVDQRESFLGDGRTSTQRQLPELTYRVRKVKLGRMPVYFSIDSKASYLSTQTDDRFDETYGRFDAAPELTVPLRVAPWLSLAISGGGRFTWWGNSVPTTATDPETGESQRVCGDRPAETGEFYCGESLTRSYSDASVKIVGPSFVKVFDSPGGAFSKFKHVIEPRFSYRYIGQFDEQARVPRFDEVDTFSTTEIGGFTLVNRVLAKPTDESRGGAFEMLSLELSQAYSFRDDQPLERSRDGQQKSQRGPIYGTLRLAPSKSFDLQARAAWSSLFSNLIASSLSLRATGERVGANVTWYTNYNAEAGKKTSDQARFGFDLQVIKNRLKLSGQINYDIERGEVLQQFYQVGYTSQCWSVVLQGREQVTSRYKTRDFRFLLNLKNVGTFLDLNGGRSKTGL